MKSHERLKAEGYIERFLQDTLYDANLTDENEIYRDRTGDYLIEIKAHYLGSKSKRLSEPAEGEVD